MVDIVMWKNEIKEGEIDNWTDWCEELMERKPEATQTLVDEGVLVEACFIDRENNANQWVSSLELQ